MIRISAFVVLVFLTARVSAGQPSPELAQTITPLIKAHQGVVGVAIKHLPSGATFQHNADRPMPTASLIKLPVLIKLFDAQNAGQLDLNEMIVLEETDKVPGSGILTSHFSVGTQISLHDAARLMIVFSDNTATNLVIDRLGIEATAKLMERLDCHHTKLHSKVFLRETSVFPERSKQFGLGSTTAAEMVSLLERLDQNRLISAAACQAMLDLLYACDDRTKIPRDLPDEVKVAHKTGAVSNSRADAGLIDGPTGRIAICVLTTDNEDRSWADDNASNVLCGRIARAAFDHFNPQGVDQPSGPSELALGADGELVEALQRTLNARLDPSPDIGVDGDFGPQTQGAVMEFQRARGLPESGRVDAAMWKQLGSLITEAEPVSDPETINSQRIEKEPQLDVEGPPLVTAKAWAIGDAKTGKVLWGFNDDQPLHPASTTKIMTGYVMVTMAAADPAVWDETVTFSAHADATIGSTSGLKAGEQVSVRELLYGLLLPSGNDASVALAEHFGGRAAGKEAVPNADGNYQAFVDAMNELAKQLGLNETHFTNTHGLTEETHQTSARDLVTLAQHAMSHPEFQRCTSTVQRGCRVSSESGYERNVLWKNTNRLLNMEGFDGIKTGTTSAAGACLVSRGERAGQQLVVALLGAASGESRYVDTKNLYRWAWRQLATEAAETAGK